MLAQSWTVSVHCPLNDETRDMISARELATMPKGAYLITAARGGIVTEDALQARAKIRPHRRRRTRTPQA